MNHPHHTHNSHTLSKRQASIALKKARTHISKVLTMIEDDQYCVDVLQQIRAVEGLLKSASEKVLKNHMQTCFAEGMSTHDKKRKEILIQEVLDVVKIS
ncbi:MAG: metal-sensitive transcriptional regulator [Candidatus Dojkabacteria bacterium]|nr:MAG: metal-sensitive transcriptional regulator [Candidatus Dojkabacteria bacterium]